MRIGATVKSRPSANAWAAVAIMTSNHFYSYEGHPINSGNFLIIQEFVPVKHSKSKH